MSTTPLQDLVSDIEACIDTGSVAYVIGPPGVGKTKMAAGIARRRGGFFATLIGSTCDPTDLCGFPVVSSDTYESDSAGHKLPSLKFAPREIFIRLNREGGILFLDELTCCGGAVQAAMLTAICDWRFGDYQLDRKKVGIIAAGNPPEIAANGQELAPPMENRLAHLTYPVDNVARREWCEQFPGYWGNQPEVGFGGKQISPSALLRARSAVAGFLYRKPNLWLDERFSPLPKSSGKKGTKTPTAADTSSAAWPSPRSWERVANHVARTIDNGQSPISAARCIAAEIGAAAAIEFQTYLREESLPDPEVLLADPDNYTPSGRVDIDFATTMAVVAAVDAKVSGPRYLAAWKICVRAVSDKGSSGPAYEAGMAAAIKLTEYTRYNDKLKLLRASTDTAEFNRVAADTAKLSKPFIGLIQQAAGGLR